MHVCVCANTSEERERIPCSPVAGPHSAPQSSLPCGGKHTSQRSELSLMHFYRHDLTEGIHGGGLWWMTSKIPSDVIMLKWILEDHSVIFHWKSKKTPRKECYLSLRTACVVFLVLYWIGWSEVQLVEAFATRCSIFWPNISILADNRQFTICLGAVLSC